MLKLETKEKINKLSVQFKKLGKKYRINLKYNQGE